MYGWSHKSVRQHESTKNTQPPSFSSSLLDEIYRSMDGGDDKSGEFKMRKEKVAKKQSIGGGGACRAMASSVVEDEEIGSHQRAFLVQKWMDMKENAKGFKGRTRPSTLPEFDRKSVLHNDPLFFSSGSSSSDSSFGWFSESEGFGESSRSNKPSCFRPFGRPKPVKTNVSSKKQHQVEFDDCLDYHQTDRIDPDHGALVIKSKARALKIYANLKKVKQPISPGGRLTTFLNSLFANGHVKKPKDVASSTFQDKKIKRKPESTHGSTCSSASSFTRSCLSKNSPRSREKLNNGIRRTVRFYPVSVIVDVDSRPCGQKFISDQQNLKKVHSTLPSPRKYDDDDVYSDDDTASDSSSDLFELDHLSFLKNCEELPVYATTHFPTNRAIP